MTRVIKRYLLQKWLQKRYVKVEQMVINANKWNEQKHTLASQRCVDMWEAQRAMLISIMENGS